MESLPECHTVRKYLELCCKWTGMFTVITLRYSKRPDIEKTFSLKIYFKLKLFDITKKRWAPTTTRQPYMKYQKETK
jgi:hypothetical protein